METWKVGDFQFNLLTWILEEERNKKAEVSLIHLGIGKQSHQDVLFFCKVVG